MTKTSFVKYMITRDQKMSCKYNNAYVRNNGYSNVYNTSTLGNIAIYVETPMFTTPTFTPMITIGNDSYEVYWGETLLLNDLVLENYYNIYAETIRIDNIEYAPIISNTNVQALKGNFETVTIEYVERDLYNDISYTVDQQVMSTNGNIATLGLTIANTGINSINNWELEYYWTNNVTITATMNADYTQNDNYVKLISTEVGSTIYPGNSINLIMQVDTRGYPLDVCNVLLNGQSKVVTTGTVMVYVENPVFNKTLFTPRVRIGDGDGIEIMWGTAEAIEGLPLGEPLTIYAEPFTCNNITYFPVMDDGEIITLDDTSPNQININYYFQESLIDLQYIIDYDLSEFTDGFVCTMTVTNLTSEDINGWVLDFEFLNNQQVDQFWSSEMTQEGNMVKVLPAEWNSIIRANSSISFGFQGSNPAAINYPINTVLNGATPTPRFATLDISLPSPPFPADEYTPSITLDGEPLQISYGDTISRQVLAQTVIEVTASTSIGENEAYLTSASTEYAFILPDDSTTIDIIYYKALNNPNVFSGYFASWADYGENLATQTQLGSLAPYVGYVPIAFGKPYMEYTGSEYDMEHLTAVTGIEFGYGAELLKASIANLKARSPYVKVLLSLGGENYNEWEDLNPNSVAKFLQDFDLDGVDIDFEQDIGGANCELDMETGLVHCTTDDFIINIIRGLRAALPRSKDYVITFSAWSVGAYGEGEFIDAPPSHLTTTGVMLTPLREAGVEMDLMNVMAYNAVVTGQPPYVPEQAGDAYKTYFPIGINCIGAHVPPDAQGTNYWTIDNVVKAARYARDNDIGGMMLWYLQRPGEIPGSNNVDLSEAIRENLGYPEYPGPLYYGAEPSDPTTSQYYTTTCGSCNDDIFSKS